jgi:hypothetical protein
MTILVNVLCVKDTVTPVLNNQMFCHEGVWGSGGITPHILNFDAEWR